MKKRHDSTPPFTLLLETSEYHHLSRSFALYYVYIHYTITISRITYAYNNQSVCEYLYFTCYSRVCVCACVCMCVVQSKQLYTTRVVSRKGRKTKRNGESDSTTSYAKKTLRRFSADFSTEGTETRILFSFIPFIYPDQHYWIYFPHVDAFMKKLFRNNVFSKLCSLRGEWLSTFELSRAAVLLTLLNLYGVYMHGHVLAGAATIRARLGVNIYRVDARISHVRTANWWKLEYRTTGRTRSPRFFLGYREISNFFFPLFPSFFFFGRASR